MKKFTRYLCFSLLLSSAVLNTVRAEHEAAVNPAPSVMFIPISQGQSLAWQRHQAVYMDEDCDDCLDLDLSVTYRYQHSMRPDAMAAYIFGNDTLTFQGSEVANRAPNALVADYFGLSNLTDTSLTLKPQIVNNIIDVQLALGFNSFCDGLWLQVNAPIVNSKWKLFDGDSSIATAAVDTTPLDNTVDFSATLGNGVPLQWTYNTTWTQTPNTPAATSAPLVVGSGTQAQPANPSFDYSLSQAGIETIANSGFSQSIDLGYMTRASYGGTVPTDTAFTQAQGNTAPYTQQAGYFGPAVAVENATIEGAGDVTSGSVTINLNEVASASSLSAALAGAPFGDLATRSYGMLNLSDGPFSNNNVTVDNDKWKVADVILQLGYDIWKEDKYHFALYLRSVIPTGTKIDQEFASTVFAPVIGNGNHFELGGGINAHGQLWGKDDAAFNVNFDGYLTHMFSKNQFRVFDMSGLPMSRYMLLKEFANQDNAYNYSGNLVTLADVNNLWADVSVAVRGEAVLDFVYSNKNWEMGLGYAFSGQTKEKVGSDTVVTPSANMYGYKGATYLTNITAYLSQPTTTATPTQPTSTTPTTQVQDNTFVPASGGASGDNNSSTIVYAISGNLNSTIDTAATAYAFSEEGSSAIQDASAENLLSFPDANIANGSNTSGLMSGQALNRIFGHVDYTWSDSSWMPTLGIIGSAGFTSSTSSFTAAYWDIGARFGFNY